MNTLQKSDWKYNQNFSLQLLKNEIHINDSAQSANFSGAIIEKNQWENVNLANSDVEATRILDTTIKNSSFVDADMHSLLVVRTEFFGVSFAGANIIDCTFSDCQFINCNFDGVTLNDSQFQNCTLIDTSFSGGSYTMNRFEHCTLKNLCFKNVFYYTHFNACEFYSVEMEAYLLGYTYGLTLENLESLQFLFMGKPYTNTYKEVSRDIQKIYKDRGMFINQGILYLLDPDMPANQAILKCFQCVGRFIQMDYLVKKEQLEFLNRIVAVMYEDRIISPLILIQLMNIIKQILNQPQNTSLEKINPELLFIQNNIFSYYHSFMNDIEKRVSDFYGEDEVIIKIVYNERPKLQLTNILKEIDDTQEARVIKTEKGSFIEWIDCITVALPYIEIFLGVLGIAVPIVWDIHKNANSKPTEPARDYVFEVDNVFEVKDISQKELAVIPELVKQTISPVLQKKVNKTIKVVITNKFIESADNFGYTNENIRSIEVQSKKQKSRI